MHRDRGSHPPPARPMEAEASLAAARRLHAAGDAAGAERACQAALRAVPRHGIALMMLSELALARGDWRQAEACARRATAANPGNALCHFTLGRVLHAEGKPALAGASYRRAVALQPDLAPAHGNLAIVLFDLGEVEAAWASGLRAVELDWSLAEAHMTVGRALLQLHHLEPAEAALRAAVAADPGLGRAHHHLGLVVQRLGRFEEAVGHHRRATALEPGLAESWSGLGQALRAFGRFDEAILCFRRALELSPEFGEAHRDLALCQRAAASEAEVAGMRALLADPATPLRQRISAAFGLGKLFDDIGDYDEAFDRYAEGNRLCREEAAAEGAAFDPDALRREVDEAIRTFTPGFFRRHAGWGADSGRPVFVVGMFRAGTSLTEQILASHPAVHGAGELLHLPRLYRQLAPRPADAERWTREQIASAAARHLAELEARGGRALRVVDKHPQNAFSLGLIATLFPQAKIICCHRDIRDNVLSCFFQRFSAEMAFSTDLIDCAARHRETERMLAHWRQALPMAVLDLQYEELVADLPGQARRLVEFLGLAWDPACLRFYETERAVDTPSAWQVRQPIYSSSVGRWRHYERRLGPLLDVADAGGSLTARTRSPPA